MSSQLFPLHPSQSHPNKHLLLCTAGQCSVVLKGLRSCADKGPVVPAGPESFVAPESLEETLKGYEWKSPVFSPATLPFPLLLVRRCSFGELLLLSLHLCGSHGATLSSRGWLWTWSRPSRALVIGLEIYTWPRLKTWDFNTRVWLNSPEREPPLSARLTKLVECRSPGSTSGELAYKCQHTGHRAKDGERQILITIWALGSTPLGNVTQ